jgi:hypothetical protein
VSSDQPDPISWTTGRLIFRAVIAATAALATWQLWTGLLAGYALGYKLLIRGLFSLNASLFWNGLGSLAVTVACNAGVAALWVRAFLPSGRAWRLWTAVGLAAGCIALSPAIPHVLRYGLPYWSDRYSWTVLVTMVIGLIGLVSLLPSLVRRSKDMLLQR